MFIWRGRFSRKPCWLAVPIPTNSPLSPQYHTTASFSLLLTTLSMSCSFPQTTAFKETIPQSVTRTWVFFSDVQTTDLLTLKGTFACASLQTLWIPLDKQDVFCIQHVSWILYHGNFRVGSNKYCDGLWNNTDLLVYSCLDPVPYLSERGWDYCQISSIFFGLCLFSAIISLTK